jgi:hypothetical protein
MVDLSSNTIKVGGVAHSLAWLTRLSNTLYRNAFTYHVAQCGVQPDVHHQIHDKDLTMSGHSGGRLGSSSQSVGYAGVR